MICGVARQRMTRRLVRALASTADTSSLLSILGWAPTATARLTIERDELLADARHEAALLRHPYLGTEHVLLAATRSVGDEDGYNQLRSAMSEGLPRVGWRPRGIFSARRARQTRATDRAHREALASESRRRSS